MSAPKVELSSKVWIRSITLEKAFARKDDITTDNYFTQGEGMTDKSWEWTFAWLLSGNIDADNQAKAPLIKVDDESSIYDGKKIEIPTDLLFSSPSDLTKSSVKRSAGRKFGASLTSPGLSHSSSKSSATATKNKDATVPNILMANASDGNLRGSDNSIEKVPHDLQALSNLHEPSVVHTLQRRYEEDMIYTSTGSQILVALNPFKFTRLYEEKVLDKYAELGTREQIFGPAEESGGGVLEALSPHVFRIADNSFRAMMNALHEDGLDGAGVGVYDPLKGESPSKPQRSRSSKHDRSRKRNVVVNQSLLVSGESGSGKTVTTKHCLRYLASLSQRNGKAATQNSLARTSRPSLRNIVKAPSIRLSNNAPPLERGLSRRVSVSRGTGFSSMGSISEAQFESCRPSMERRPSWILGSEIEVKILEANPILEAFGNARTVRNDNSSRFGKYIELFFSRKGSLIGATIETYLLEKVRLIHCEEGERNYHIFYEIMDGASEEELNEYLLDGYEKEDFKIINQSGTMDRRDGVEDQEEFDSLIESMSLLQFDPDQVRDIMRVSVACMHALNLSFTAPSSDESDLDDANPHLQKFLNLMGIERKNLHNTICYYEILIGGRDKQRRNQSKTNAEKGMEAFIKSIYNAMFTYLVDTINQRISIQSSKSSEHAASIGILDIFGFESFQTNSLEQLMINYCNEALQQLFNAVVFKSMKEEYDREGIDSSFISFPDNQDALDAIDKKGASVLSILNDMSFAPGTNDEKFVSNLYQRMDPKSSRFIANPLHQGKRKFVINHYAGPVEYSTEKWIEKNKDEVPRAMVQLLESSSNSFVKMLALVLEVENDSDGSMNSSLTSSISRKRNQKTVAKQFSSQLLKLREKIGETTPYFVRCIKPNQQLTPDNYCHKVVLDQLKSLGVMEAVRVSRSGFSKSYTHEEFIRRYRVLAPGAVSAASESEGASNKCKIIMKQSLPMMPKDISREDGGKGIQIGTNKVFLRQQLSDNLDRLRNKVIMNAAVIIQTGSRVWLARNELFRKRAEFYSTKIQAQVRRVFAARKVKLMILKLQSATLIQSHMRGAVERKRWRIILEEKRRREKEDEERRRREEQAENKKRLDEQNLELRTISATIIQSQLRGAIQRMRLNRMVGDKIHNEKVEEQQGIDEDEGVLHVSSMTKRAVDEKSAADTRAQKEEEERRRRKEEEIAAKQKLKEELARISGFDSSSSVDTDDNPDVIQLKQKFSEVYGGSIRHSIAKSVVRSRRLEESKRHLQNEGLMFHQDSIGRKESTSLSRRDSGETRPNGFQLSRIFGPSRKFFDDASSSLFGATQPAAQSSEMFYTVWLPITEHGLLINVTSFHGGAAFASYRKKPDGNPGPAELNRLIRCRGDRITAVNEESCLGKPFAEVVQMLVKASQSPNNGVCKLVMQDWKTVHYQL